LVNEIGLLVQSEMMVADDGQTMIDISQEASLQMDTAPATPPAQLISLWQQNMLGIKAERYIYWLMRRDAAVQRIGGVTPIPMGTLPEGHPIAPEPQALAA
jgi:hypothetical protein